MSTLPHPTKVAGVHMALYETYYNMVDPNNYGQIGAMDAAKFLKKSQLSDKILSKIWDISDPSSRGFLDKPGMFVALKLCALAQQGHSLTIANIFMEIPPPKMGDCIINTKNQPCPQSAMIAENNSCWSINPMERSKYEQLFRSLEPINGYISGNKVKSVLMDSKLPLDTLGKIWDLADIDKDGKLNQQEFIIAMHLVYKALEKNTVPNALPVELMDSTKINKSDSSTLPQVPVAIPSENISSNLSCAAIPKELKSNEWVVSHDNLRASDKLFLQADEDMDGFVSGAEIKDVFFQSGLSQTDLANIWNLCDISQNGKLNNEQFALSMWLIKQRLSGIDLPTKLLPEMVPPSFRKGSSESGVENNNISSYSNPELDMIHKDITEIIREKHALEQDISQKEADIKIKTGEIKSLQSELDTLAATLRQLDNQKGEAQKRLNDLKAQVEKLGQQAADQESTIQAQENELQSKRQEIESLKLTEQNLEAQQLEYKNQVNLLSQQLQNIQLQVSQTKANMTQLEEQQRQIVDGITIFDGALATGDASVVSDSYLLFKAKLDEATYNLNELNNIASLKTDNAFNNNHELNNSTFNSSEIHHRPDHDPFESGFNTTSEQKNFVADPFTAGNKVYDPFHDSELRKDNPSDLSQIKDPFGEDPFAALHAPVRSESPSPALPPKKSKQPPPRPAPPRPAQGPLRTSASPPVVSSFHSDPFSDKVIPINNPSSNTSDFADFTNFDSKG